MYTGNRVEYPNNGAHVSEQLPEYTLGLLNEQERRLVAAHLEICAVCQAELRAYEHATEQVASAIPAHEPPADLRNRIVSAAMADSIHANQRSEPSIFQRLAQAFKFSSQPGFGGLAILVILLLLIGNVLLFFQVQDLRTIAYAKAEIIQLEAAPEQATAGGILLIQNKGVNGILIVDGMQPLTDQQQYQLWLIRADERISGGVFSVNSVGYGYLSVENPRPLSEYDALGITVEPFGGSPGPTSPKVLGAEL